MTKKYMILLKVCLLLFTSFVVSDFSVMTWNMLSPWAPDAHLYFKKGDVQRLERVSREVQKAMPDVVCLQEVGDTALAYFQGNGGQKLDKGLSKHYDLVANQSKTSPAPGKPASGGTALFIKKGSDLHVVEHGSKLHNHTLCVWSLLQSRKKKQCTLVASVHISRPNERSGQSAGHVEWDVVLSELKSVFSSVHKPSIVIAGDFNTFYEEVADKVNGTTKLISDKLGKPCDMYHHGSWTASSLKGAWDMSVKPWKFTPEPPGNIYEFSSIDHVVYSGLKLGGYRSWVASDKNQYRDAPVVSTAKSKQRFSGKPIHEVLPSDHAPVFVTFDFVSQAAAGGAPAVAPGGAAVGGKAAQAAQQQQALKAKIPVQQAKQYYVMIKLYQFINAVKSWFAGWF